MNKQTNPLLRKYLNQAEKWIPPTRMNHQVIHQATMTHREEVGREVQERKVRKVEKVALLKIMYHPTMKHQCPLQAKPKVTYMTCYKTCHVTVNIPKI